MRRGKYNAGGATEDMIYDDTDFTLFAIAMLAVYWIPVALFRIGRLIIRVRHKKTPMEEAKEAWCSCSFCQEKADRIRAKKAGFRAYTLSDFVFVIVTVLLIIACAFSYRSNVAYEKPFDPFEILGVPTTATERQIKKAYRTLSITLHPDKNPDDPTAQERFIQLTKARDALTDEAAKENFIKYGNPDGYMGTTWGLGLPKWVGERSQSVLLAYAVFTVILFPAFVGIWWHRSKQQLTTEITTSTFTILRESLRVSTRFCDLLAAFCGCDEFNILFNSDHSDGIEQVKESLKRVGGLPKSRSVVEPSMSHVHNVILMTAYLARLPIPEKLHALLSGILLRSEPLLTAMADIVGVFQRPDCMAAWDKSFMRGHTMLLSRCLQLTQSMYQALDEKSSPLLQIPHFTEREVKFCSNARTNTTKSIYDIMRMDISQLQKQLRYFTPDQVLDVKAFCDRFPCATLEVKPPCVEGEDISDVHHGDQVTVRTTLRVLRRTGSAFSPHVPRLPYRKEEVWWLWIADHRRSCPIEVRRLLPRMARGHDGSKRRGFEEEDNTDEADIDPTADEEREKRRKRDEEMERLAADPRVTVFEVVFRFMAPTPGVYTLEVKATCDCYSGAGKSELVTMKVKEALEPPEIEEEKLSSDEEDESEEESSDEDGDEEQNEGVEDSGDEAANGEHTPDDEDESEYEYIEVTASESEAGDFDDDDTDDDDFGITATCRGDPAE